MKRQWTESEIEEENRRVHQFYKEYLRKYKVHLLEKKLMKNMGD